MCVVCVEYILHFHNVAFFFFLFKKIKEMTLYNDIPIVGEE